jgi:hypothetical protein
VRRPALAALGVIAIIMLAGAMLTPVTIVRVQPGDGQPIICHQLASGESIVVSFTHSMYGGLVTETWHAAGTALVRDRMVTENAAAAEYYAWDGRILPVAGGYEVIAPPAQTAQLRVMIDDIGNHHLRIGSRVWPLANLLDTPIPVAIGIDRQSLAAWLVNPSCQVHSPGELVA